MRLIRLSAALAALAVLAVGTQGATTAPAQTSKAKCTDCGVIQSMRYVEEKGQGTGVGAVTGGVLGGVVGHQFGSGRGNTAATIVGAGAGILVRVPAAANVQSGGSETTLTSSESRL